MSGLSPGVPLGSDAQWARQITQRVKALEGPTQQRIGTFVVTDDGAGNLVAHSPSGAPVAIAGPAASSSLTSVIQSAISKINLPATAGEIGSGALSTLTADIQKLIDSLVGFFGGSGTGNPLSALTGLLSDLLTALSLGSFAGLPGYLSTLVGGLLSITTWQTLLDAIANALGQSGIGFTIANIQSYLSATIGGLLSGAVFQSLLDAIANALGQSGVGFTIANIEAYLSAIPGSVISGITTVEQDILDAIANALGFAGLGHTVADIESYIGQIPQSAVAGLEAALGSILSGPIFQNLLDAIANALGFAGTGHTIGNIQTYLGQIPQSAVAGLEDALGSILSSPIFQNLLDAISNALGFAGTGHTIANIQSYLTQIPQSAISGLTTALSGLLSGATFQSLLDAISAALGFTGTGHTIANIQSYLTQIPQSAISGLVTALGNLLSTTTFQSLLDAISAALGHAGVGHTVANIQAYLGSIPGSVISGITTLEQNLLDAISNALGQAGTGHTVANIQTYLGAIPGSVISGITTLEQNLLDAISTALGHAGTGHTVAQIQTYLGAIPGSLILGITSIEQSVLDAISAALGFAGTGHSVANIQSYLGLIPQANISGLATALGNLLSGATFQTLLDAISNALGQAGTGHTIANIQTYLGSIPQSAISGLTTALGNLLSGATFQTLLDAISAALGFAGTGHTIANIQSYLGQIPQSAISGLVTALGNLLATTTFQTLLDAISAALGHSGVGHTVANIQAYLGAIPGSVISGITSIEQNMLDAIANALGQAGVGHTVANIQTYLGSIPQSAISGLVTALGNLLSTATWQTLLDAISNALGFAGTGHSVANIQSYLGQIPQSVISGLATALGNLLSTATFQTLLDAIANALGFAGINHTVANVQSYLTQIPQSVISGLVTALGNLLPTSTFQTLLDAISNALGFAGINHTVANIQSYLGQIPQSAISGLATALGNLLSTATWQTLLDAISAALGHAGVGHTVANIQSYLGSIPGTVISGITGIEQNMLDAVANALGFAGVNHTVANIQSYLGTIPQANISGLVTALGNLLSGATFQTLLDAIANALGQAGTGHTVANIQTYLGSIPQSAISGLVTALGNLLSTATWQTLLDQISNALGFAGTGHSVANIGTYLGIIPQANISGLATALGNLLSGATFQTLLDAIANALGQAGTGHSVANIGTYLGSIPQSAISGLVTALGNLLSTATWQTLLDAISAALGHAGTGHTVANIQSYLGAIPGSVISGITTIEQNMLDAVANALGFAGVNHTVANIQSYLGTIPQANIIGLATALGNLLSGATFQTLLDAISNALGQAGTGHTVANIQTYLGSIPQSVISGLVTALGNLLSTATFQTLLDAISNALGFAGINHTVANVQSYLTQIPQSAISGLVTALGNLLSTATWQTLLDAISNALGFAGIGHTVANVQSYLTQIPQSAISGLVTALGNLLSTATWQTLLDAISTALGHAGTGHTVANIQAYLGAIPGSVISGITAIEQNMLDAVANALGFAGPNHTISNIQSYLGTIPQANISGLATALGNLLSGATFQTLLDAISNALGQAGTGHTVANVQTYLGTIPQSVISGLATALGNLLPTATWQTLLDAISNALGFAGTGHTVANIQSYLGQIPQSAISGLATALGNLLSTATWQTLLDAISNALGRAGTGHTVAQIQTYLGSIPGTVISGITTIEQNMLDAVANALGFAGPNHTIANIQSYLGTIPQGNISGLATALGNLLSGATFQTLLDAIANALGQSGTGHSVANIQTYLGSIPQSAVSGLVTALGNLLSTATWQTLLDAISNALGFAGTGHTVANIQSYLGQIPQSAISGLVTALGNLLSTATWQTLLDAISNALGFAGTGHSVANIQSYLGQIPQSAISGLVTALGNLLATTTFQSLLDAISVALGHAGTGHTVANIQAYLGAIPGTAISGITSIEQNMLDAISNALGQAGTGHTVANIQTYLGAIPQSAISGLATSLSALLSTATWQTLLDAISNALGQAGVGHTVANVQTYLGSIPQSAVSGLVTALGNLLSTATWQTLLDAISNALGFAGIGHTVANVQSYLTQIPQSAVSGLVTALGNLLSTATWQTLLDAISTALGHSGVGHTVAQIQTYLGSIPGASISGITTLEQNMLDAISNALGQAGTGHTVANIQTYLGAIPQSAISGLATSLSALLSTATWQTLLDAISNALGQAGTGHSVANIQTYLGAIPQSAISGLVTALGNLLSTATFQTLLDAISNALGQAGIGHTVANIQTYMGQIPSGATFQSFLDAISNALGQAGVGHTIANVQTYLGTIPQANISGLATALGNLLSTATWQTLLDAISNALGFAGVGHSVANVQSYLGQIPQSAVNGLVTALGNLLSTATWQTLLDAISNALGRAGTGHTVAQIQTYLGSIPGTAISGITTLEQNLLDAISNALGQAGVGHTIANVQTYLGAIPQSAVSGLVTALGNLLSTATWQTLLDAISNALGFAGTGHTVANVQSYLGQIPQSVISGLATALGNLLPTATWQTLLDAISNALGRAGTGHTVAQIQTYLGSIPGTVISGITTIEQNMLDAVANALGFAGVNHTVANIQSYLGTIPQANISGLATALGNLLSGATFQTLLDAISNALGQAGIGHTVANIQTYMGQIPSGATFQSFLDAISNALGQAGVGHTIANVQTYLGTIPQANISGLVTALGNLLSTATWQTLLDAISNALGFAGTGHSVANVQSYLGQIPQSAISGLVTALGNLLSTATWQTLLDAISNALGRAGTGHTVAQIQTYLGSIPGTVISGITTLEQNLLDAISNALGQAGVGHTIANVQTYLGAIPQSAVSGLVTALGNLLSTATWQTLLDAISNALGFAGTGHTVANIQSYLGQIPQSAISGLVTALGNLLSTATWQTLLDAISNALGRAGTGHTVAQIQTYLGSIPGTVISGITTLEQNLLDAISNALGQAGVGHTIANVQTYLGAIPQSAVSGLVTALGNLLSTATWQTLLDAISNALGFAGTGHTVANIQSYLGQIPQSAISGLVTALGNLLSTATWQTLLDAISNALGRAGTGHTVAQIQTYLGSIPGTVISGITTLEQNLLDAISNALGQAGVGHTIANVQTYLGAIPQSAVSGLVTALGNLLSTATWQTLLDAISNALGFAGTGHTVANIQSYLGQIPQSAISGLVTALGNLLSTATWQTLLDAISNALGRAGTGHTVAQIQTYLGSIPGTVISGITTLEQNLLDAISNALGQAGVGHTIANVQTYLGAIPQSAISGLVTALGNLLSTATWQTLLDAISNALGYAGINHTVANIQTYMGAIPSGITFQSLLDAISNALGRAGTGHTIANIQSYLGSIPGTVISSITGTEQSIINYINASVGLPAGGAASTIQTILQAIPNMNIVGQWQTTLQDDLTTFQTAISTGITDVSATIPGMTGALSGIAALLGFSTTAPPPAASTTGITTTNSQFITDQSATHPTFLGLDPTADAVFNVDKLLGVSPVPMVALTQAGGTLVGFITVQHGGAAGSDPATWPSKKSVEWLGYPTGGNFNTIDAVYLVLNKMDPATGIQTKIYKSPNIVSTLTLGTTRAWNAYNFPALNYIIPQQGDVYGVEMILCGAGTYNVGGIISDIPAHPTWPGMHAATRATTFNTVAPSYVGAGNYTTGVAPTLDHVAGGPAITTTTNTPNPITWMHNISANANLAVIGISFGNTGGTAFTVTCGGQTMTPAASTWQYSTNHYTQYFYLVSPPTGSSVAMSVSYAGGNNWIACESWSVIGASGVGAPINNSGSGTALTQTVTNTQNTLLLNMMAASPGSGTIGSYNKTQDANCGYTAGTYPTVFGHTAGSASSITFTCTATVTSGWGSTILPIFGIAPSTISWVQNTVAGDTVLAAVEIGSCGTNLLATPTATVTCGGVAMTLLQTEPINNVGTNGIIAVYAMPSAPGGNQTIIVTPAVTSGKIQSVAGGSVSYANVRGVAAITTGYGTTSVMSVGATDNTGGVVFNAFGANVPGAASNSSYSGTSRWATPAVTSSSNALLQIGDSATTGAFNVTDIESGNYNWAGINVVLLPTPVVPSTIATPTWASNVPEFLLCGAVGTTVYPPDPTSFTSSGTFTPPDWMNHIDILACGGGGNGTNGGTAFGGKGGTAGSWATPVTLNKGQWTPGAAWTITIGGSGAATTVVIPGYGTITANPGAALGLTGGIYGESGYSAANVTYNGPTWTGPPITYLGGGGGPSAQAGGAQPGGGGGGGNCDTFPGTYIYGGLGGAGIARLLGYM